ncbi:hypothetical protein QBC37DRAFT_435654 [Rhypophila decipiens]|uniref:Uncharacterized protein n=1 Tax=Rhypophila decipiens TaxID=261697 RepID=A0AAN7B130_9PEZI|nr:hypothetical protein QBC37DRAFT_435654 [Rhypophila decipiens]
MRATAMGVDCIRSRWSVKAGREGVARAARLVVVSADVDSSAPFSGYMDGLLCAGLLQRIFIDEWARARTATGGRAQRKDEQAVRKRMLMGGLGRALTAR